MMRAIIFFCLIFMASISGFAQCGLPGFFCMQGGNVVVSDGNTITDDAGGGPYTDTDYTWTLCPDTPGDVVQLTFSAFALQTSPNPNNSDYLSVFDGNSTAAPSLGDYTGNSIQGLQITGTVSNTSGCLTLVFSANGLANASSPGFEAQVQCTTPCANPTSASKIVTPSPDNPTVQTVSVCLGDPVTFGDNGSFAEPGFALAHYIWNFDDGTVVTNNTAANISHTFNAPGEYIVTLTVEDNNLGDDATGCTSLNLIPLQVLVSTYPTFSGMEPFEMCLGETVVGAAVVGSGTDLPGNAQFGGGASGTTWTALPPQVVAGQTYLADGAGFSYTTCLTFDFFEPGATLADCADLLNIFVNMEHSYMGDLGLFITCPDGTSVNLVEWGTNGGGGTYLGEPIDNETTDMGVGYDYYWTPDATNGTWGANATGGTSLPSGTYQASGNLCDLVGCPLNGDWCFSVTDNLAIDNGYIFAWGIAFNPELYPGVTTFTPSIGAGPDSSYWVTSGAQWINDITPDGDQISITPEAVGTFEYTYVVINSFGCQFDTTITVTCEQAPIVTAGQDAIFSCGAVQLDGGLIGDQPVACGACGNFTYCYDVFDFYQVTYCPDVQGEGVVTLTFNSGTVDINDNINVYDGPNTWPSPWLGSFNGDLTGMTWTSTDPSGCLTFYISEWDGVGNCTDGTTVPWDYTVTATSATAATFVWDWNPGQYLDNANIQDPTVTTLNQTTTFTLNGYPAGHPDCNSTDQVVVSMDANSDPGLDTEITICSTDSPFDLFSEIDGTPTPGGSWYDGAGNPLASSTFDPLVNVAGNYEYQLQLASCVVSSVLTINLAGPTQIQVPNDTLICEGGQVNMFLYDLDNGAPGFNYNWTYGGATVANQPNATYAPTTDAPVCLTVTDACDYVAQECFNVTIRPALNVVFEADTTAACYPDAFQVNALNPATDYATSLWEFSDGTVFSNVASVTQAFATPGAYDVTLTLTNDLGCSYSASYSDYLTSYAPPVPGWTADPQPTNILEPNIHFTDVTTGAPIVSYNWQFTDLSGQLLGTSGQSNPEFEFPSQYGGTYLVYMTVTDENNCTAAANPGVIDINDILQFYVPTAFTPNGDGINDVLLLQGADIDPGRFYFKVFDRNGMKIFETNDPTQAWVGDVLGGDYYAQNGVYNWIALVVSKSTGERKEIEGSLTIIR